MDNQAKDAGADELTASTPTEQLVRIARQALTVIDDSLPGWPGQMRRLGVAPHSRYQLSNEFSDLEESITATQQAADLSPANSLGKKKSSYQLAVWLGDKYYHTLEASDLDEPITLLREAIKDASPSLLPAYLGNLGIAIKERYLMLGYEDDYKDSCQAFAEALHLPDDHNHRAIWLSSMAELNKKGFDREQLDVLQNSLDLRRQAASEITDDNPLRPTRLGELAAGLYHMYFQTGKLEDLEESVEVELDAIAATPEDDPE
ncbi:hypothetical protein FZEAL_2496 [Fusarium zealandicum]|uniref:Uncharacterized protein n=1 Tax=Fusarium zealandicum TaxID=1053134 RepID=A0A8H4XNU3_9HYPO|nr:hypothetical protein FZEAL_2496 [Fusarium zealandicum]